MVPGSNKKSSMISHTLYFPLSLSPCGMTCLSSRRAAHQQYPGFRLHIRKRVTCAARPRRAPPCTSPIHQTAHRHFAYLLLSFLYVQGAGIISDLALHEAPTQTPRPLLGHVSHTPISHVQLAMHLDILVITYHSSLALRFNLVYARTRSISLNIHTLLEKKKGNGDSWGPVELSSNHTVRAKTKTRTKETFIQRVTASVH
ncbi:hypothetical protein BS50DRAFT_112412 [Corynespora cassiicola Philippines]|uniref:Uncharacterized protein n=1 Tax=Corynespora cassiicola Philippines TaxID=1448308 RepID=A0A2T2NDW2_CORCC|nr:hypothetical protein BS50DRAFT_112412 [Corynespora cassiicola Philippines]